LVQGEKSKKSGLMTKSGYENIIFPVLRQFDPETIHERTITALRLAQRTPAGRLILRHIAGDIPIRPVQVGQLVFPNVLGVAAGFDKDARVFDGLAALGFGHVEIGTLTPRAQVGNPRPRVFRLPADQALINRMGFPNEGVVAAVSRLRNQNAKERHYVLGISLGKQKETPLEEAVADYRLVMQVTLPYADYLAINISSPNTPGLRELQGGRYLENLLSILVSENKHLAKAAGIRPPPLWVKVAPDLSWGELDEILATVAAIGIDGIIAANTTLARHGLKDPNQGEAGGLSGRPLRERSTTIIQHIHRQSGGRIPVIGVGGVASADDIREKLDAGAVVVQLYTGLIYGGPGLPGRLLRELESYTTRI
jgi:dihydroorotate dehydrogenase